MTLTLTDARQMIGTGHWILKPFLAVGLLIGLLLSLLLGGVRFVFRALRKGVEPRGMDLVRAQDTHDIAEEVTNAARREQVVTDLRARLALKRIRARTDGHERLVARRQSMRQQPREHQLTMLAWMDSVIDDTPTPDLRDLPDGLRATLDRMAGDHTEIRAMRQSLSHSLGLDGVRQAAAQAATERNIKSRLAAKNARD